MAMLRNTMLKGEVKVLGRFSSVAHCIHTTPVRHKTGAYYVLLPETPPDSQDDNAVMQFQQTPKFSVIRPVHCITGCAKLAIQFETQLNSHIQSLSDTPERDLTFSKLFDPVEELSVPLNTAWRTGKHLNYVGGTDYIRSFLRIHPQVEKAKQERWNSEALYRACKQVKADSENLNEFQHRQLSLYVMKGHLNGQDVQGEEKRRFVDTQKVLALECNNFRRRVMICQSMFTHKIDDFSALSEMPRRVLTQMAEDRLNPSRGPWQVTLHPSIYIPFMEHCSNRLLRWNAWNAYNNRASVNFNDRDLGNHKLIEELRQHRKDTAQMLGYTNFAELAMQTKMAGSVEKALDMIETLRSAFWCQAREEITELQQFAISEGFTDKLQVWDIAYWRRRHRQQLYNVNHTQLADYFPLEYVLKGLFDLCGTLFGVKVQERTGTVETWHEDVRYFELHSKHGHLGSFFFDPFSRPRDKLSGSWVEMGRERSELMGTTPYSYLVMNLEKPDVSSSPVVMQFAEVLSLFHEFGNTLQQLMSRVPYSELAGQNNIEFDAVKACADFMQRWALDPLFLQRLSSHSKTGENLSDGQVALLLKSHKHFSAYDMMRQLYLSAFDMEIYLSDNHWHDIMTRVWVDYMPIPLSADDNHPCSFTHVFSGQHAAAYYSYKWSEMMGADMFAAFQEGGLDNAKKLQTIGARFADTFLSLGGGVSAGEVFRRFRGRDPSVDALIEDVGAAEYMAGQSKAK